MSVDHERAPVEVKRRLRRGRLRGEEHDSNRLRDICLPTTCTVVPPALLWDFCNVRHSRGQ
jgi:hypothetical protein